MKWTIDYNCQKSDPTVISIPLVTTELEKKFKHVYETNQINPACFVSINQFVQNKEHNFVA